jgi:hypothetical protein
VIHHLLRHRLNLPLLFVDYLLDVETPNLPKARLSAYDLLHFPGEAKAYMPAFFQRRVAQQPPESRS